MSYFFDSSAIVKRYRQEAGSASIQAICKPKARPTLILAALAQVEVPAALRRAGHEERQQAALVEAQIAEFRRHVRTVYRNVPLAQIVLDIAGALCDHYWRPRPLKTLDALQLACAVVARQTDPGLICVTADARLEHIATQEGLAVVNPLAP